MIASNYGIEHHGLTPTGEVHWNLQVPELIERAVQRGEGRLSAHGAVVTETVPRTVHPRLATSRIR